MNSRRSTWLRIVPQRLAVAFIPAAAFLLAFTMAMPSTAWAERAVKARVAPLYPEIAKRMKITGMVKMEVTVDPTGKVLTVKTLEGNRMLSTAAEDAVKKWKFDVGDGVETVHIDLNFTM